MIVTINDLLGNAKKREEKKKFKVFITELDREIECTAISRAEYIDLLLADPKDLDSEIIYLSCPIFKDEKLITSLKCSMNPVEVIDKILSHQSIYALAKTILDKSDLEVGAVSKYVKLMDDDIKN